MVPQALLFFFKHKFMKRVKETVGMDVSNLTLDVHFHKASLHQQLLNDAAGFKKILAWDKVERPETERSVILF